MTENPPEQSLNDPKTKEIYPFRGTNAHDFFLKRSATKEASFLVPHLRPGMRLLDCGCGPGSITIGLAKAIAPGYAVGIDIQQGQVEKASALASEMGADNVQFQVGNVLELPFPDSSFDAAFANGVLMYLRDPLGALKEMRRVLKPGGVVGVRDVYVPGRVWEPFTSPLQQYENLVEKLLAHQGRDPRYPLRLKALLKEAGFVSPQVGADTEVRATPEDVKATANIYSDLVLFGEGYRMFREQGRAEIESVAEGIRTWGESSDALQIQVWPNAVGWVPE